MENPVKKSLALAQFAWRLPVYWRIFKSQRHRWERHLPYDTLFLDSSTHFRGPDLTTGHEIFESMVFEREGYKEAKGFLRLATGCSNFVDLGASGGFFSALFAASRESGQILSVEPDPASFAALQSTRDKNVRPGIHWDCDARGAGAEDKSTPVYGSGYGVGIVAANGQTDARTAFEMHTVTLESLCKDHSMVPDLIKFDVESMEYEILQQSAEWLRALRPRLHLELHTPMLRKRGLNEDQVLKVLDEIGYRLSDTPNHDLTKIRRNIPADKIIQLDLIAPRA